jgi:hypothetical protein
VFRTPTGWSSQAAGEAGILFHPSGPTVGHIRIWRHAAAIDRLSRLVGDKLRTLDSYTVERTEPARLLTTEHGDPAALVATAGRLAGEDARAHLGFVVLADEVAAVVGVAVAPEEASLASAVREVIVSFDPGESGGAWRFLYAPPAGWHGRPNGLGALWYPPGFPRQLATITVAPAEARPATGTPHHIFDAIVAADRAQGFVLERSDGPDPIGSDFGLAGFAWSLLGVPRGQPRLCRDLVVLADDAHVYTFILAAIAPEDREAFLPVLREVVRSAHPRRLVEHSLA